MTFLGDLMLYPELTTRDVDQWGKVLNSETETKVLSQVYYSLAYDYSNRCTYSSNNQYICPHPSGLV